MAWSGIKTSQEILVLARVIFQTPRYEIQIIADRFSTQHFNIKILFLSVAHPELNPIELTWSHIKRTVASKNLEFQLSEVEVESRKQLLKIDSTVLKKSDPLIRWRKKV